MKRIPKNQRGGVLVLVVVSITIFAMMLAFALDFGTMVLSESELQAAADSAALAGAAKLADEDRIKGQSNQSDDIASARDFAETFAGENTAARKTLLLDRNDANEADGGVVVGYIENPLDLNSQMQTANVSQYNSVEVRTTLTHELNGPLALLMGGLTGVDELEMSAKATATVDDRISGFMPSSSENLMMLPFAAYEGSWNSATDGVSDSDVFKVVNGVVSSGRDGVPELTLYPFRSNIAISGITGNVGALFVCGSGGVNVTAVANQIRYGMTPADFNGLGGFELTNDGAGEYRTWIPGESWASSDWHNALKAIKGKPRIISIFRKAVNGKTHPVTFADPSEPESRYADTTEVCCGINQQYEVVGFKAVTVVDSQWPSSDTDKKWVVQPTEVTTGAAKINPSAPHSKLVYSLSLTR